LRKWLINGCEKSELQAADRGLAYGDGLFETIAIRNGKPRFLERHLRRLAQGCIRLEIKRPREQILITQIERLCEGEWHGTMKVIVTRGPGPRGYAPAEAGEPTVLLDFSGAAEPARGGSRLPLWRLMPGTVPASTNARLAGIKSLNRLDSVLARAECIAGGYDETVMRAANGQVVGGAQSNIFIVRGGRIVTPLLDQAGVAGVMRGVVLDTAARLGIDVVEAPVELTEVTDAAEIFMSNSLMGIRAASFSDCQDPQPGSMFHALSAELALQGVEECSG